MEKRVVVKQNTGLRIFLSVSSIVIIVFWIFLMIVVDGWYAKLITSVLLLTMIVPVYYWRWELVLYKDKMSIRRLCRHREYSYSQIKYVKEYDHIGHRRSDLYLIIHLLNDKEIKVQSDCMNFVKCRNELLRHMSIQHKRISLMNIY